MAYQTIILKAKGGAVRNEAIANAEIYPGHLVELMSTGKLRVHSRDAGVAEPMFAVEDELQGKEIGDAYAATALVQYDTVRSGDEVYARITGSPAVGDKLTSAGDGTLRKLWGDSSGTVVEEYPIAVLLATAASGLARVRII